MAIYSIPGMNPGKTRRKGGGGRVVVGSKFRGTAAPGGRLVPYEPVKPRNNERKESAIRARDVADAYEHVRNQDRAKARFG